MKKVWMLALLGAMVVSSCSDDEGESSWVILPVKQAKYNLLNFTNGLDALLSELEVPSGLISQIRLILGADNKLKHKDVL